MTLVGGLVLIAAIAVTGGLPGLVSSSTPSPSPIVSASRPASPVRVPPTNGDVARGAPDGALAIDHRGRLGARDGVLPDGTTVGDDDRPGLANLDPSLLDALRRAARDADKDGIDLLVASGWRSPAYQERLLEQAIATYGSKAEAARWVATPDTSPHVAGDAVDIGPAEAVTWLSKRGSSFGLCRIYGNEPWHFELRPDAVDDGCPPTYDDPTEDPRMQP